MTLKPFVTPEVLVRIKKSAMASKAFEKASEKAEQKSEAAIPKKPKPPPPPPPPSSLAPFRRTTSNSRRAALATDEHPEEKRFRRLQKSKKSSPESSSSERDSVKREQPQPRLKNRSLSDDSNESRPKRRRVMDESESDHEVKADLEKRDDEEIKISSDVKSDHVGRTNPLSSDDVQLIPAASDDALDFSVVSYQKDDLLRNAEERANKRSMEILREGVILKNYQRWGVNWLLDAFENKAGAILADEMGKCCSSVIKNLYSVI